MITAVASLLLCNTGGEKKLEVTGNSTKEKMCWQVLRRTSAYVKLKKIYFKKLSKILWLQRKLRIIASSDVT